MGLESNSRCIGCQFRASSASQRTFETIEINAIGANVAGRQRYRSFTTFSFFSQCTGGAFYNFGSRQRPLHEAAHLVGLKIRPIMIEIPSYPDLLFSVRCDIHGSFFSLCSCINQSVGVRRERRGERKPRSRMSQGRLNLHRHRHEAVFIKSELFQCTRVRSRRSLGLVQVLIASQFNISKFISLVSQKGA